MSIKKRASAMLSLSPTYSLQPVAHQAGMPYSLPPDLVILAKERLATDQIEPGWKHPISAKLCNRYSSNAYFAPEMSQFVLPRARFVTAPLYGGVAGVKVVRDKFRGLTGRLHLDPLRVAMGGF